ncbi:MAG: hypothetical protein AAB518_00700 [Patescibacteria group bacterium]
MASKSTVVLAGVSLFLCGLLVGILIATPPFIERDAPREVAPAVPATNDTLAQAVEALTRAISGLQLQLVAPRTVTSETPSKPAHDVQDFAIAVSDLSRIVGELGELHATLARSSPAPRITRDAPDVLVSDSVFAALHAKEESMVAREHQFWSTNEVFETYGRPDKILQGSFGIEWQYERGGQRTIFCLVDGQVANVMFD